MPRAEHQQQQSNKQKLKKQSSTSDYTKDTKNNNSKTSAAGGSLRLIGLYNILRYHVVPPLFVVIFTLAVQFLAHQANPSAPFQFDRIWGNWFSWKVVGIFMSWGALFLLIPCKVFKGPVTSFGYVPLYSENGIFYYFASISAFIAIHFVYPDLSIDIFQNMPYILGSMNVFAFVLCLILLVMGKWRPQSKEKIASAPVMYEFYRGMEIHPRMLGMDVKQWTNCRVGMMAWQILILAFLIGGYQLSGSVINPGHVVNVLLQSIYICKFFWWETGYFNTLDITLDRAGYYICWGCLVWVPAFYTYSSYYLVAQSSLLTTQTAILVAFFGVVSIGLNYRVDYEKQLFRTTKGKCQLWGRPVRSIRTVDQTTKKSSNLLVSGLWGWARKLNYTFEILAALCWCGPGFGYGVWPFLYAIFLTILLVIFRDEEKCRSKYGAHWKDYCKLVPYRMIPYVF